MGCKFKDVLRKVWQSKQRDKHLRGDKDGTRLFRMYGEDRNGVVNEKYTQKL
jgi:hypothetical protein